MGKRKPALIKMPEWPKQSHTVHLQVDSEATMAAIAAEAQRQADQIEADYQKILATREKPKRIRKPVEAVATPEPVKDVIPQITVEMRYYLKISNMLDQLKLDTALLEAKFKCMKYDDQQDAYKFTKAMHTNIHNIRRIMFPGSTFN